MWVGAVIAVLAVLAALFAARAHVRESLSRQLPPGVPTPAPQVRALAPDHHDEAVRALRAFAAEFRATRAGCDERRLRSLHRLRAEALGHLYQLRMRLPNDLGAETRLVRDTEDTDQVLQAQIADAASRCGVALLHPGPLGDLFYRKFYRAHNDDLA